MHLQKFFAHASTILIVLVASVTEWAQAIAPICAPKVTANVVVASAKQQYEAGQKSRASGHRHHEWLRMARHTHRCD